jgi:hypothetical protein
LLVAPAKCWGGELCSANRRTKHERVPSDQGRSLPQRRRAKQQIRARLGIIKPYTNWIRTFSCTEGNQHTPCIAHENGLKTKCETSGRIWGKFEGFEYFEYNENGLLIKYENSKGFCSRNDT